MPDRKNALPSHLNAALLLADGKVFWGRGLGAETLALGEVCFNTAMTGYQEVLTDPSYAGQIVTFTFPHVGNVGCNDEDIESVDKPCATGLVIRESITEPSNFRAKLHLDGWLKQRGIAGISGVDTRALTRYMRTNGAQNVAIVGGLRMMNEEALIEARRKLHALPSLKGLELCKGVTTKSIYEWNEPRWSPNPEQALLSKAAVPKRFHVVAVDYGDKLNILRCLASLGCRITVVPAETSAEVILGLKPDGVFLSNGPGDPAATGLYALPVIRMLIESGVPLFGICLGHQLLGLALDGKTEKMHQGHRGANHPIKNLKTGKVEITSQNHGFTVTESSLPSHVEVTHISLFDGTVAGLKVRGKPIFAVQYHPEASPGPHDSLYLFEEFVKMMEGTHAKAH